MSINDINKTIVDQNFHIDTSDFIEYKTETQIQIDTIVNLIDNGAIDQISGIEPASSRSDIISGLSTRLDGVELDESYFPWGAYMDIDFINNGSRVYFETKDPRDQWDMRTALSQICFESPSIKNLDEGDTIGCVITPSKLQTAGHGWTNNTDGDIPFGLTAFLDRAEKENINIIICVVNHNNYDMLEIREFIDTYISIR